MPLETGKSTEAFKANVETEVAAGKPQKQAVAIAYAKQRETKDCDSQVLNEIKLHNDRWIQGAK